MFETTGLGKISPTTSFNLNCILILNVIEDLPSCLTVFVIISIFIFIIPQLTELPLKTLERCAVPISFDKISIQIHIRFAEFVIVSWQIIRDYFCWRLFDLQFDELFFGYFSTNRWGHLGYLRSHIWYVLPICSR